MAHMPLTLEWPDVCIRISLAVLAGILIGYNRSEAGKDAGLRTTLLVCLAACLAMLMTNALLGQAGKASDSFIQLDLMRLPLGILSGVGFIGAGAILRKDGLVKGLTTAATLWFVQNALQNPNQLGAGAYHYMHIMGIVTLGLMWLRMAKVAAKKLSAGTDDKSFYEAKLVTARYFAERYMPDAGALRRKLEAGSEAMMALSPEQFEPA